MLFEGVQTSQKGVQIQKKGGGNIEKWGGGKPWIRNSNFKRLTFRNHQVDED